MIGPCPNCGKSLRQTRADGRCVACGKAIPDALRAPAQSVDTQVTSSKDSKRRRARKTKSINPPRDIAILTAFNVDGEVVLKRRPSLYRFYEDDNPLIDLDEFRAKHAIVRVEGKLYDDTGKLLQEFENRYSADGALIDSSARHH